MKKIKIRINVTALDIDRGNKRECSLCPIARAMGRHRKKFPGKYLRCYASQDNLRIGDFRAKTKRSAYNFINNFDNHGNVKPFSFTAEFELAPLSLL